MHNHLDSPADRISWRVPLPRLYRVQLVETLGEFRYGCSGEDGAVNSLPGIWAMARAPVGI